MGSYSPGSSSQEDRPIRWEHGQGPEILPPGTGYISPPPPPPVRKPRPWWSGAPATNLLVGINCAVFVAMVMHGASIGSPTVAQLMHWGADNAGSVLINGEWWRIVTAMFVHVGILHLATNMWCLWNLGLLAEPLLGSWGVLAAYLLTGAAGNLLSTFVNWYFIYPEWVRYHAEWVSHHVPGSALDLTLVFPAGAGASGAVFGIAGVLIVLLKSHRLPVPPLELKKLRRSVIYFAVLNLVLGLSISVGTHVIGSGLHIDNMAHVGGFMCGLIFAAPMVPRLGSPRTLFKERLRIATIMVMGMLVLFGFYLAQLPVEWR